MPRDQSEHGGGFRDTTTPQMGFDAITSVFVYWEHLFVSGQLGRSTGQILSMLVAFGTSLRIGLVWTQSQCINNVQRHALNFSLLHHTPPPLRRS